MWDTAGQERFRTITTIYYRGVHAIIVVYDVNDEASLDSVERWVTEAQRYCRDDALIIVVGCKTDLKNETERVLRQGQGEGGAGERPLYGQGLGYVRGQRQDGRRSPGSLQGPDGGTGQPEA